MSFTEQLGDDHGSANRAGRTGKNLGQQLVEIVRKRNEQRYKVVPRLDYENESPQNKKDTRGISNKFTTLIIDTFRGIGVVAAYVAPDAALRDAEEMNATHGF